MRIFYFWTIQTSAKCITFYCENGQITMYNLNFLTKIKFQDVNFSSTFVCVLKDVMLSRGCVCAYWCTVHIFICLKVFSFLSFFLESQQCIKYTTCLMVRMVQVVTTQAKIFNFNFILTLFLGMKLLSSIHCKKFCSSC